MSETLRIGLPLGRTWAHQLLGPRSGRLIR